MGTISSETIFKATGFRLSMPSFDGIGLADSEHSDSLLTFLGGEKYANSVNQNPKIRGVFVTSAQAKLLRNDIEKIVVDDPVWTFFSVVDFLGKNKQWEQSRIYPGVRVHPSAFVAQHGVILQEGVEIEAQAVVMPGVSIGRGSRIRPGAVIGIDGYEHKKTGKGVLSVTHDGDIEIGEFCEVGVNTNVAKGFSYRRTLIGNHSKIDALVHYAHGVQCGERCLVVANAMVGGNVTMGDDVWIGPSASIANRLVIGSGAFVTMGSVVTRNVGPGEKVTGNFAIPHVLFLQNLKKAVSHD